MIINIFDFFGVNFLLVLCNNLVVINLVVNEDIIFLGGDFLYV